MTDTDTPALDNQALIPAEQNGALQLFAGDTIAPLQRAAELVTYMSQKCTSPAYISNIAGRRYPKVEWWTTVGASLGLFPREVYCKRQDRPAGEIVYEALVEVHCNDKVVARASAICSSQERNWGNRDEYALRSMATTRATGKAFRLGLSFLAVMAGLEPTPADEVPPQGFGGQPPPQQPPPQTTTPPVADPGDGLPGRGTSGQITVGEYKILRNGTRKDGSTWQIHGIITTTGSQLETFDDTFAALAQEALAERFDLYAEWTRDEKYKSLKLTSLRRAGGESTQQTQPTDEDDPEKVQVAETIDTVIDAVIGPTPVTIARKKYQTWAIVTPSERMGTFNKSIADLASSMAGNGETVTISYGLFRGKHKTVTYIRPVESTTYDDDIPPDDAAPWD
jgi:hypothetical protein